MSELAKCPECGGECISGVSTGEGAIRCLNDDCPYEWFRSSEADAVKDHNRLAGRCRWVFKEDEVTGFMHWAQSCSDRRVGAPGAYCSNCGKQIEEVSE